MSSVTFPTAIGGDGSTVTDDDNATTGLRNGGWRTRFIPCFTNLVNIANYMVSYTAQTSTFAAPPPMGSTTPNTGAFTRVTVTGSTAPANGLYLPATNALGFATNSTERVRINSSGNVGIGTSSPTYKLDVKGNLRANITTSGDGTGVLLTNDGSTNGRIEFLTSDATGRYRLDAIGDFGFVISTVSGGVWEQALYIDRVSRNLGLGVTPSGWGTWSSVLQGNAYALTGYNASGNVQAALWCNSYRNSGGTNTYYSNGYATQYLQGSGTHAWFTAPSGTAGNAISFTQAMTLDANGNLLVGLTASVGSAYTLQVRGAFNFTDSAGNQVCFYNPSNGFMYMAPVYNKTTASAANVFVGSAPGDMYRSTSALKYKQDIRDIESIDINKFRPVRYRSKCENDDQSKDHFGIIADEALEAGFPELVIFGADGEPEGFQYERLTAVLVKAVQDLSAELNLLKQKVNA